MVEPWAVPGGCHHRLADPQQKMAASTVTLGGDADRLDITTTEAQVYVGGEARPVVIANGARDGTGRRCRRPSSRTARR